MLGSSFDAEDAVQETLLRAWRASGRFEGRAPLQTWLYRIATNVCLDALGQTARRPLPVEEVPEPLDPRGEPDPADRALARERLALREDEFAIVLVGRMEYQKNHALALRAFSALEPATRERSVLLFVGAGENEPALRDLAAGLGIAPRVRFLGYRTDVASILPGADVLLMSSWFEGMPLALIEAMLAKVPIVTTPWMGASDMLDRGNYGLIAAGFAPEDVAAAIERAHANPELRRALAERAERHARQAYDIRRTADAHRTMYLRLCGSTS
jgi:RNA polymerase sigma factor (sigma-70 family)